MFPFSVKRAGGPSVQGTGAKLMPRDIFEVANIALTFGLFLIMLFDSE